MIIKTKRLLLSPMTLDQLREKILSEPVEELQQAYREMLQGCLDHPESSYWYTAWQILLPDGTEVGSLCFKGPAVNGAVEVGYGVDEDFRGQGYATEALRNLCKWAFSQKDVYFITAETQESNAASRCVLEKCGFKPTGKTGDEGPLFELEREPSSNMSIMMCIGMCLGTAIGSSTDNLSMGLPIGVAIGIAIGSAMDSADKKKRQALRDMRSQ